VVSVRNFAQQKNNRFGHDLVLPTQTEASLPASARVKKAVNLPQQVDGVVG
jgi:hypothetical protein